MHSTDLRSRPADADVAVLRWPSEALLREQLAWFGLPRVLLLAPGVQPPEPLDGLEDWMRDPADPGDLHVRRRTLQRRATVSGRSRKPESLARIMSWRACSAGESLASKYGLDLAITSSAATRSAGIGWVCR